MSGLAQALVGVWDAWRPRTGTRTPPSPARPSHRREGLPSIYRAPGVHRDAPLGERGRRVNNRPRPADDHSRLYVIVCTPLAALLLAGLAAWLL